MRRSPAIAIGLLIAIALGTAWAFSVMLGQRFISGEVYPPCSTQRADPMGSKALYEAVDRLGSTTCERNFKRLAKLSDATGNAESGDIKAASRRGQTLVLLNVAPSAISDGDDLDGDAVLNFAASGGRVVITVDGQQGRVDKVMDAADERQKELREKRREAAEEKDKSKKTVPEKDDTGKPKVQDEQDAKSGNSDESKAKKKAKVKEDEMDLPFTPTKSLREVLHIAIKKDEGGKKDQGDKMPEGGYTLETLDDIAVMKGRLPAWRSKASLDLNPKEDSSEHGAVDAKPSDTIDDAAKKPPSESGKAKTKTTWTVLAKIGELPVLAERRFSHGSVVIATDSHFVSNEALLLEPSTEFLAWLIGDARHVIFDETHLGTQENPGIMTLARRFRLHGFFIGGVLLFALFVWQSSSSLVPANDGLDSTSRPVAGQGAVAGLVSLLRRGIPRAQTLRTGFEQWLRNHPHPNPAMQTRIEQARALLPPAEVKRLPRGTLVGLYQRLCETIHPNRN